MGEPVAGLFLLGVAFQITQAMTYKMCMWYLYQAEMKPRLRSTRRHQICEYVSEAFWIELLFDFGSLAAFAAATLMVVALIVW